MGNTHDGQQALQARQATIDLHPDGQRLLEPLPVVIPFVDQLCFRDDLARLRRDHAKYLALIAASAMLHQYQRVHRSLSNPKRERGGMCERCTETIPTHHEETASREYIEAVHPKTGQPLRFATQAA